jgi:hypothetical protein
MISGILAVIIAVLMWVICRLIAVCYDMAGYIKTLESTSIVHYYNGPTPTPEQEYYWNERLYRKGLIDEGTYLKRLDEISQRVNIDDIYGVK